MRSADKLSQDTSRGISEYRILAMGSFSTSQLQFPPFSHIFFPIHKMREETKSFQSKFNYL
jgi:hypothetical protein